MARKTEKEERPEDASEIEGKSEDEVDALFTLPLEEFVGARNALAARVKKGGNGGKAGRVKGLLKPSLSAWAVNQLYWKHREAFDGLLATGQLFRQAQAAQLAGKSTDVRGPRDARREALSNLSRLAAGLLRDAGHSATPDTLRRITTTLEAMSAYALLPNAPPPGRLTADVDPPGFEAIAALIPAAGMMEQPKAPAAGAGSATIASVRASLRDAERALNEVRAQAERADAALKKANHELKEAENHRREAQERFEKASAASEEAGRRARNVAAEAGEAAKAVADATRAVEKANADLQSLL